MPRMGRMPRIAPMRRRDQFSLFFLFGCLARDQCANRGQPERQFPKNPDPRSGGFTRLGAIRSFRVFRATPSVGVASPSGS